MLQVVRMMKTGGIVRSGVLRHVAVFERQTEVKDAFGNVAHDWQEILTTRANVMETTGRERIRGGSIESVRTATLRLRSTSGSRQITAADRVKTRGETWRILSISNLDDKGRWLDVLLQADTTA